LVISLQCGWIAAGCVLHLAQQVFVIGNGWYGRLGLMDMSYFSGLEITLVLLGIAAALWACQAVAVLRRSCLAAGIVGLIFALCCGGLLTVWLLDFLGPPRPYHFEWEFAVKCGLNLALFLAGCVMFHWAIRIRPRDDAPADPLPSPPSADDDD
jgi:hypothetical protein